VSHLLGRLPFGDERARAALLSGAFPAVLRAPARAGDAVLYLSSLFHRGTAATSTKTKRASLVLMMQVLPTVLGVLRRCF
jgi:ectoine hydroxylase-related dioxygenase (phytanoyl-CoA dioxygenase family)